MRHGHGCARVDHQGRQRSSDKIAAPDDHDLLSSDVNIIFFKQFHDSPWRAWKRLGLIHEQTPHVFRMRSVNVFFRIDRINNRLFINMLWKLHLHQNSMHVRIVVVLFNHLDHVFLFGICRHCFINRFDSDFFCCAMLVSDINLACFVVTNQNYCKRGRYPNLF